MKRLFKKLIQKLITFLNFNLNKKVKPYHLLYNQLQKDRSVDMSSILKDQIKSYLSNSNKKKRFILIEIGSYMGESLELWGDLLEEKLGNNFLIISIDPYIDYASEEDKVKQPGRSRAGAKMTKVIEKIYMYFIHNISLKKRWRDKHIHLRTNSKNALNIIDSFNIKIDFCYIDGSHYYENFKFDLENYSKILESLHDYKGVICGDDYEISYEELLNKFNKEKVDKMLNENKKTDCLIFDEPVHADFAHFHPGITLAMYETKIKIKRFPSGFFTGAKS